MTKILAFAGKKQSGKTSAAHFMSGYILSQVARLNPELPLPKSFRQDEDGEVIVNSVMYDENNEKQIVPGVLDFSRTDAGFVDFASQYIWPYVKIYTFAEPLKIIAMNVFGLTYDQCYGSNEDKNTDTNIKWADMAQFLDSKKRSQLKDDGLYEKFMTAREFMQYFGTNVCRKLYDNCWIDACLRKIAADAPDFAIIDDCRFPNEVKTLQAHGAKVIRLVRSVDKDTHDSEKAIDEIPWKDFDAVIRNEDIPLRDKNQDILDEVYKFGWFTGHISLEI